MSIHIATNETCLDDAEDVLSHLLFGGTVVGAVFQDAAVTNLTERENAENT